MVDFIESKEFATFHIMYFIPKKICTHSNHDIMNTWVQKKGHSQRMDL